MSTLPDLPVREVLSGLRDALRRDRRAVLVAPPGAGKTTLVPPGLLDAEWLEGRSILMLEPRRLAARAAAHRITDLLGEPGVGGTAGYRVRFETRVGPTTRIEVVTEGILTRMLHSDPALEGVGLVIFDEFHERSLHADVGLALALQSRELFRPELGILVMSATLDAEPVAELLGGAPVIRSEGRIHPVETRFEGRTSDRRIEGRVAGAIRRALQENEGDILVFLPGAGEIRRTGRILDDGSLPDGVEIHRLHGSLSREAQDHAIRPSAPGRRKVVLSSAIAESSLTIEGVRVVVDSGLMRVPRFDPGSGMTRLETVRVSRDSADQRRGRAGRQAPGVCYRLWTRGDDRGLVPGRTPEILEADLAGLLLELRVWGADPGELKWLDPPPESAVSRGSELLEALGLLDSEGSPTEHGRQVAGLGIHPRMGHMLLRAQAMGRGRLGCEIAALLGERDVLRSHGRLPDADLRLRVEALRGGGGTGFPGHEVDRGALHRAKREARHWARRIPGKPTGGGPEDLDDLGLLVALAFPDRIARRREGSRGRFLLRNGRGGRFLESQSLEGADWIVALELDDRGRDARIFRAAALEGARLEEAFASAFESDHRVEWDPEVERVVARRRTRLGAITVHEGRLPAPEPHEVARALLEGIRASGLESLPWSRDQLQLRRRLTFLHHLSPEGWPDRSDAALLDTLEGWLLPLLATGRRPPTRPSDLDGSLLTEGLLTEVAWEDREAVDRLAPTHFTVPSGSRVRLDYDDPEAPVLAVRIQELFGLEETPRIGGGRVPLTLHLLSPARRPVQVTRDLGSFWEETYFEVRKDLRGRYPKHYWPEDPLQAEATHRVRPR